MRSVWGVAALLVALGGCSGGEVAPPGRGAGPGGVAQERAPALGPDGTLIDEIRVTVRTGTVNGAGTQDAVKIWFDNRPQQLSRQPTRDFAAGATVSATLLGRGVPRTLGELRRASIVLALQLNRAEIGASWYCDRVSLEVKLAGADGYDTYLESDDVGWLSQDEPPRRSSFYALQ
jgi:hypothetical protein